MGRRMRTITNLLVLILNRFSHIKEKLEAQIQQKVFMSDMAEVFYNVWQHVMLPADFR